MKKLLILLILCCGGILYAQNYQIGDLYTASDGSRGIVYYLHPDGNGGWVVALNDASTNCVWGTTTDVPGLANQNPISSNGGAHLFHNLMVDTSGYINTRLLRSYQNSSTTYAAGKVDFANGWVLPSPAQLSMLFGQLPFVTSSITNAGGTVLAYDWYWCSAERDASTAWRISFGVCEDVYCNDGSIYYASKTDYSRVRAVRSFTNSPIAYDTALTYQWNTGSTQPYINVNPAQTTTYQVTATSDYGCSNTAEQTVLVGSGSAQTIYDTICKGAGYEANGFVLTAAETGTAGTLTRTRTMTTSGCSSNLTLQLMVKSPVAELVEATTFGSYIWNGVTYYESGDYTQTFTAANGCDSVVTLRLTISPMPEADVTATADTICSGDEVTLQTNVTFTSSGPVLHVPPVAIGDILCTDGSIVKPSAWPVAGKTARGVVFYVDSTNAHGWAMHLQDQATSVTWGNYQVDIPDLPNYSGTDIPDDINGYSNTQTIRATGPAITYPAAWAVDFDDGWYLPAAGQLSVMSTVIMFVNPTLSLVEGQPLPVDDYYTYWSSTECSATYAWRLENTNGVWGYHKQIMTSRVRSVCTF